MMGHQRRQAICALAACCLLAAAAQTASAQAAAAAGAGGAVAAAGALPAVTLGSQCQSSASVSPWDTGSHFPNVIICCGGHVDFQWSGVSGVWQLSSATCPAAFTNSTTARQLLPTTQGSGGVKSLYLPTPGTFYFTSPVGSNCASGLLFRVQVPPGSGSVCPVGAPAAPATVTTTAPAKVPAKTPVKASPPPPAAGPQTSTGPGSMAAALGPPGQTSTSTAPGAAGSASGPNPQTATAPGMSFSSAGNGRKMLGHLLRGMGF